MAARKSKPQIDKKAIIPAEDIVYLPKSYATNITAAGVDEFIISSIEKMPLVVNPAVL